MQYIIQDWAGNICFDGKSFDSFDDAWGFLYEFHDDEEMYQEYSVIPASKNRESRYLDPCDPRASRKSI
jgi:hypothetical protein